MEYKAKQLGNIMLNANEAYCNLSDKIREEIKVRMDTVLFHRYPDETSSALRQAYSKVIKQDANKIIAGNGSDEMLGFMISHYLKQGDCLFTLSPDFSMYDYYASIQNANIIKFQTKADGSFSMDDFIEEVKKVKPKMILFSNPNNPTGHYVPNEELLKLVKACSDIVIIVDEAYGEFALDTMIPYTNTYKHLFVTRTLSKAYGLAAARLGFLIGHEEIMKVLRKQIVPYNISTLDQVVGEVVLAHATSYKPFIEEIKRARDAFYQRVKTSKYFTFYPSQANYLYGKSAYKNQLLQALQQQDIIIRNYQDDSFRITIGSKEENEMVLEIIEKVDKEVEVCEVQK